MELFVLYFYLLFHIELSWILNYMNIIKRKYDNRIIATISRLGVGLYKDIYIYITQRKKTQ